MPLIRRIPKRGFTNPFKQIGAGRQRAPARAAGRGRRGDAGDAVRRRAGAAGRISRIKLLGTGDVGRKFVVKGVAVSASARAKIEQAGGTIEA